VVNFAAETHVDRSLMDPLAFVRTDVEGTLVLLDAARQASVRRFVQISTDEVYGSRASGSFSETDVANPRNPYAASKLGAERIAYSYHESHALPVVIVRPSNNYGPFQHAEKFIPLFVTNALLDRPVPLYGDGQNVRDWLHVEDNCRAIARLADVGEAGEVYNVCGGNERPNIDQPVQDRVGHDRRYSVTDAKLRALGWRPEVEFERGLEETVRWYRDNESWWRKVRDASFEAYYQRQYVERERAKNGG